MTSRVVFPATSVATLRLSPTYCGSLRPDPADPKDTEPMVRIVSAGKHKYLLFPEWRLPDDDKLGLKTVTNLLHMDSQVQDVMQLPSDLRIRCRLRMEDGESAILFDYQPETPALNGPKASLVEYLQSLHAISGNDLRTLFTKVKLAKPGYYAIGLNHYSNQDTDEYGKQSALASTVKSSKRMPSIKIDGKSDEWLSAQTVLFDSGDSALMTPNRFNVTSISYLSDEEYYYFFIKFRPDIEAAFKARASDRSASSLGNICRIVCDTDLDASTGCPDNKRGLKGHDLDLLVSAGSRVLIADKDNVSVRPSAFCDIEKWDQSGNAFEQEAKYNSIDDAGLISWGVQGVELAVERAQFGKLSDVKVELVSVESIEAMVQIALKAK